MILTLSTSVLDHIRHCADSEAPHAALATTRAVWRGWRKTGRSTIEVDHDALVWLNRELDYLAWCLLARRLLVAQIQLAPFQVEQCLRETQAALNAHVGQ